MATERNPENTRLKILKAAFVEMHKNGYQGMRVDQVLEKTGLKKGALYHHFSSKQILGYAVLEELIETRIKAAWITPLHDVDDPLLAISQSFEKIADEWSDSFFYQGCPLNNLAQEMSPIDEGFRQRIETFFNYWQQTIVDVLQKGQQQGIVANDIALQECAVFIISSMEGALGITKNHQDTSVYQCCCRQLKRYLETLRA